MSVWGYGELAGSAGAAGVIYGAGAESWVELLEVEVDGSEMGFDEVRRAFFLLARLTPVLITPHFIYLLGTE